VNFSFDDLVGHKRYRVERLTRACGERGSIRLPWLTDLGSWVFYEKRAGFVKKIGDAKTAGVNHAHDFTIQCYSFANFPAFLRS
jgi:hypothetical protein